MRQVIVDQGRVSGNDFGKKNEKSGKNGKIFDNTVRSHFCVKP